MDSATEESNHGRSRSLAHLPLSGSIPPSQNTEPGSLSLAGSMGSGGIEPPISSL